MEDRALVITFAFPAFKEYKEFSETFLTMLRDLFITEENTAKEAGAQIHAESDNVGNISDKAKRGNLGHNNWKNEFIIAICCYTLIANQELTFFTDELKF